MNSSTMKHSSETAPAFWINWLIYTAEFTVLFGLFMVLAPGLTQQGFGLMLFQNAAQFATFDAQATAYIALAHAVMGSVMAGWGVLMFMLVRTFVAKGVKESWGMLAASVLVWYVPDTAFSIYSGFWQNAVMNTGFAMLYSVPLVALRKHFL